MKYFCFPEICQFDLKKQKINIVFPNEKLFCSKLKTEAHTKRKSRGHHPGIKLNLTKPNL